MAYINSTNAGLVGSLRDRVAAFLTAGRDNRRRAAVYRQTVRELNSLTDRELTDLGISRLSIERIAHEAAYGR